MTLLPAPFIGPPQGDRSPVALASECVAARRLRSAFHPPSKWSSSSFLPSAPSTRSVNAHPSSLSSSRRRNRPRSDGRSREGHPAVPVRRLRQIRDREGSRRRMRLRRARGGDQRGRHGPGRRRRRRAPRRGRGPQMGLRALRGAPRSRAPAAAQGSGALRQPQAGRLLPGAGLGLVAEDRGRRGARHHDRPGAYRRRLFRGAEADHRPRQWPEARDRHAGVRHLRDRADRPRRLRSGAQARQQGDLGREAQRDEVRRLVERGDHRASQARVRGRRSSSTSSPTRSACSSSAGRSSST